MDAYINILIRIFAKDETSGTYPVEAILDDKRVFSGGQLYIDHQALLTSEINPEEYGRKLFNALFNGPIRRAYDKATGIAEDRTSGQLRVQLWIDDYATELHALHWERLYHEHRGQMLPLATSTLTPFSRYMGLELSESQPINERPIRLLIAIANPLNLPKGLSPINVEREIEYLLQAFGDLRQAKQIQVTMMPGRSGLTLKLREQLTSQGYQILDGVTSIDHILQNLPGFHVFHFLGHGHFRKQSENDKGTASLFLEDADGSWKAITDDSLIPKLTAADPLPHLVFLAACESARQDSEAEHPFVGLGPRLARAGIAAVVAMQDIVPIDLLREVISNFYHRLMEHGVIDRALNEARMLLFEKDVSEWATPVLFMRLRRGQLFAIEPISVAPFQSPPLPSYFVRRHEVINALKSLLLVDEPTAPGILVVSAIHGLGGVGKSTQAAALTRDPSILHRFPDGVLWAELRQDPDILSILSSWLQDGLSDYTFRPTSVDAATARLRSLLKNKAVLMVVDDAWNASHVRPFLAGGVQCRMIITTRETHIAAALDATIYDLDVMTPEQALELLSRKIGREFKGNEREEALRLARTVGYLPLALDLAAAQVIDGIPWTELLIELSAEIARLEALDYPGIEDIADIDDTTRKRLSLIACFNLSLRRLPEDRRRMFAWLGILPKNLILSPIMTTTLWDISVLQSRNILTYFRSRALLLLGVPLLDGTRTYRLHDLLHAMARRLLTDLPVTENYGLAGLGMTLQEAHTDLLERYKNRLQNGLWYTLPDDKYIHSHLTWHMEQACQIHEMHALLKEEHENRNAWYQAQDRLGQTTEFLEDVFRAWRMAEKDSEEYISQERHTTNISLEVRYALITASINTLAQNIPHTLLTALVGKGIWTPAEALAYALRVPESKQRAETLMELVPYIPDESLQDDILRRTLAIVEAIENERERVKVLASLASNLGNLGYAEKALVAAKAIGNTMDLAITLTILAPQLAKLGAIEKVLATAKLIKNSQYRTTALIGIIPYLQDQYKSQIAQQALAELQKIKKNRRRVRLLVKLVPHLSGSLKDAALRKVLATTERIRNESIQAEVLLELIPYLPKSLYNEALTLGKGIENNLEKAKVLGKMAIYLLGQEKEETLRSTLITIWNISDEIIRADTLVKLAPILPDKFNELALEVTKSIVDRFAQTKALVGLSPYLKASYNAAVLADALIMIRTIENEVNRAEVLVEVIPHLPGYLRKQALLMVREINDTTKRIEVLVKIGPHLPEVNRSRVLTEALDLALSQSDITKELGALKNLIPYLPEWQLHEALTKALNAIRTINDKRERTAALAELVPQMPESLQLRALEMVRAIDDEEALTTTSIKILQSNSEDDNVEKLARLSSWLVQQDYLYEALVIAWAISNFPKQLEPLVDIVPRYMELGYLQEALTSALIIENPVTRAEMLLGLLYNLPPQEGTIALEEAVAAARIVEDMIKRAKLLVKLIPLLPHEERFSVFTEALMKVDELPLPVLQEALAAAKTIRDARQKMQAYLRLIPHLPEPEKDVVLEEALAISYLIGNAVQWAEALLKLMPYLPEPLRCAADAGALAAVRRMGDWMSRADVLVELAELGYPQQALAARMIKDIVLRLYTLARLLPHLPEPQRDAAIEEVLTGTNAIEDVTQRTKLLLALLPYLAQPQKDDKKMLRLKKP